jgi:hypothetical protein
VAVSRSASSCSAASLADEQKQKERLTIQGLETYLLTPRDLADLNLLVEAVRPTPRPTDLDAVIGLRGPIAPPETCNGLMVPIVVFDQIYSFDRDALIKSIPRPEKLAAKEGEGGGRGGSGGSTPPHRARDEEFSADIDVVMTRLTGIHHARGHDCYVRGSCHFG